MNLKTLSVTAYFGMMAGVVVLVLMRSLFSRSWLVIALQAAALFLFFWARISFRFRRGILGLTGIPLVVGRFGLLLANLRRLAPTPTTS